MTKIDIFSGFLGAGKTTLIKKLIQEAYVGEKLVLIENEFGEIGIDGGFMKEAGIEISEMNSGCICCSLVGDFTASLLQVLEQFAPDRILIEPSGVGKLSDVIKAVQKVESENVKMNTFTTVVDANKCKVYSRNFGEFYNNQVEHAACIVFSRTDGIAKEKLDAAVALLREKNAEATFVTTPWSHLSGQQILAAMERQSSLAAELSHLTEDVCPTCCHEHHHHHDDEECHCHDHEHHHHHHAGDVFDSWGVETVKVYTAEEVRRALEQLEDETRFGTVLRAKGIVAGVDGWIHFDYVPGAPDVRNGGADVIGRLCVIGAGMDKAALTDLFRVEA